MVWWSIAAAGVMAGFFSCLELLTSKYPNVLTFLLRSPALYKYGAWYGFFAAAAAAAFDFGVLDFDAFQGTAKAAAAPGVDEKWLQVLLHSVWGHAAVAGLTTKAIMQLNLFTLTPAGKDSVPIGLQLITHFFEPKLLRTIAIDEFFAVRKFVERSLKPGMTLEAVRSTIKNNVPPSLPEQERKAFADEIDKMATPLEAMEKYLRFIGRKAFNRAFPA